MSKVMGPAFDLLEEPLRAVLVVNVKPNMLINKDSNEDIVVGRVWYECKLGEERIVAREAFESLGG